MERWKSLQSYLKCFSSYLYEYVEVPAALVISVSKMIKEMGVCILSLTFPRTLLK